MMIKTSFWKVCLALCASTLCLPTPAQIVRKGDGYLMRVKLVKGQTLRYLFTTTTQMATGTVVKVAMPMTSVVRNVVGGVASLHLTVGPIRTGGGMPAVPAQSADVQMDNRGVSSQGASAMGTPGTLPKDPVRIGQTWVSAVPIGNGGVEARYIFRGLKMVKGRSVAVIDVSVVNMNSSIKVHGKGTMRLLASDGTLYDMDVSMSLSAPAAKDRPALSVITHTLAVRL